MDIGKILFTLSYVKYIKQFDFNILVNGKSVERKVFPSVYKNFRQFCFNLEPKVKRMFLFTIYKTRFSTI